MQIFSHLRSKRRKSLFGCILFSVLLHCVAVVLLQQYSLWFYSSSHYVRSDAGSFHEREFTAQNSDEIFKTTFQRLSKAKAPESQQSDLFPHQEVSEGIELLGIQEPVFEKNDLTPTPSMNHFLELFQNQHLIIGKVTQPGINLNGKMQSWPHEEVYRGIRDAITNAEHLYARSEIAADQIHKFTELHEDTKDLDFAKFSVPISQVSEPQTTSMLLTSMQQDTESSHSMTLKEAQYGDEEAKQFQTVLPVLPSLSQLNTRSCSEGFDLDIIVTPRDDGQGYLFALTLIQNPSLSFDTIKQNFYFLIDRSNSIQAKRLHSTCHAVIRALSFLPDKDRFNILAFDNKIERLSAVQEKVRPQALKKAKKFLMNLQLSSFFTSSNFQKPLNSLLFEDLNPAQAHSLIVLSNGEALTSKMKDLFFIGTWTDRNRGYSVHTLGLEGDKNLPFLNLLCEMNQGKLVKSSNKKGIKRKLIKLVQSISNPIATNLSCTAVSLAPRARLKLLPDGDRVANLYSQQPFVILGTTETLDDFVLFIQGRHKDQWLNIKKTISFKNAKKAGIGLKQQWALEQTYECFDQFSKDGNALHLIQADNILEPFDIESVFKIGK